MRRVLSVLLGCGVLARQDPGVPGTHPYPVWYKPAKCTWDARSALTAHTKISTPQSRARLLRVLQPGSVRAGCPPWRDNQLCSRETPTSRGARSQLRTLGLALTDVPSPRAERPGSFLLAKQRIKKQPSNLRNERLQQTLMTRTPFFPSACLRQPEARETVTNMYLLPFSSPLKKDVSNEKVIFP